MQVNKRTGKVVPFEEDKIVVAIMKAMKEVDRTDEELAKKIAEDCKKRFSRRRKPIDIEEIQDYIEISLMDKDPDTAKKFIIYRVQRATERNKPWEMTTLQSDIYENKYRYAGESFDGFLERISGGDKLIKQAIHDKEFLPAGRIIAGMGTSEDGFIQTLSNCYVLPPPEDSIESIFNTARDMAKTYSRGGGVGIDVGKLRPKGSKVHNAARTTSGAVSFMDLYSLTTGLIGQAGRRGALMISMPVDHPDIQEFVTIKSDLNKVTKANISVRITDEFMEAAQKDEWYKLKFEVPDTGEVIEKDIEARKLLRLLSKINWDYAEPGMLFWDKISSWHIMSEDEDFEYAGVNPCAEEPLPPGGSCLLGSINLSEFVDNPFTEEASFDYERFEEMVKHGVIYLNNVLDIGLPLHPLDIQKETVRDLRQIGLGIMGLADMLIKLDIRYGSDESIEIIDKIGSLMVDTALMESSLLAKEDGPFRLYKEEAVLASPFVKANASKETLDSIKKYGLRNSQLLTIAPTGSISTIIGTSGGVEPIFQISYTRKSESLHEEATYYKVVTPIVREYMNAKGIAKEEDLPDTIVTSSSLNYEDRIKIQATWQKYIDASISSTVNLPKEATVEEVYDLYTKAWEAGCKGITIYRDGCARSGILITDDTTVDETVDKVEDGDVCPLCGGKMMVSGGCEECQDCGYSPCAL